MDFYDEWAAELEGAELGTGDFNLLGEPFTYPDDVSIYEGAKL
jgi:hypothetical protein